PVGKNSAQRCVVDLSNPWKNVIAGSASSSSCAHHKVLLETASVFWVEFAIVIVVLPYHRGLRYLGCMLRKRAYQCQPIYDVWPSCVHASGKVRAIGVSKQQCGAVSNALDKVAQYMYDVVITVEMHSF